jgi:hypothetical protein
MAASQAPAAGDDDPFINPGGGTVTNYYKDNGALDSNDTGDQRSSGRRAASDLFHPLALRSGQFHAQGIDLAIGHQHQR